MASNIVKSIVDHDVQQIVAELRKIKKGNSWKGITEEESAEEEFRKGNSGKDLAPFVGINESTPYCLNSPIFKGLNVKAHLKLRRIKGYDMLLLTFTPLSLAASNNMGTTGSLGGPVAKTSEQFSLNSMCNRFHQPAQEDTRTRQQHQHQL